MSISTLERKFAKPHDEISEIQNDLITNYSEPFASVINTWAIESAENFHNLVCDEILTPFIVMNKAAEALPKNSTKEQYHQFLERVFKLSNPKDLMGKIENVLNTNAVVKGYDEKIKELEKMSSIKSIFEKSKFPNNTVKIIQQNAMISISNTLDSFHYYVEGLQNHQEVMREVAQSRSGKRALKTGASILGLGLGIPFLGLGLGALMNSGDRTRISNSINELLNRLDFLSEKLTDTIIEMNHSLHLLFLTLYGGTIVTVNEILKLQHIMISHLETNGKIHFELVEDEKRRFTKWVESTVEALDTLGAQKRYAEAIPLAKTFFHEVHNNPVHAQSVLANQHTAIYISHTYYYALYQEALLAEYNNDNIDAFVSNGQKLYKGLQFDIPVNDLPKFASDPSIFMLLLLKETIKQKDYAIDIGMARTFIHQVQSRYDKEQFVYEETKDILVNPGHLLLLLYELEHMEGKLSEYEASVIKSIEHGPLTVDNIKYLIELDKTLGPKDEVSSFLRLLLLSRRSFNLGAKIRKVIIGTIIIGVIGGLGFGAYKLYEPGKDKVSGLWQYVNEWFDKESDMVGEVSMQSISIANDTANIRNLPDYNNSQIVATATFAATFEFTGIEIPDESGADIIWLEIIVGDTKAYVSKKIVRIIE